ncbi:hypothetical protein ACQCRO_27755, partial [Ralstonia pseudosolanacearum]|uniref:hypothetical protein n=1 Tax=Ralstonia pseudosolanacearum TaxID=1310165 RepID=UPI003CEE1900
CLNPNAPLFVPCAYRNVQDFSDQWWELVNTSAWFRDYWLQECFQDPQQDCDLDFMYHNDDPVSDVDESDFHTYTKQEEAAGGEKDEYYRELVSLGALKWRNSRGAGVVESPRYSEKAPRYVNLNLKVSPRAIQQPR